MPTRQLFINELPLLVASATSAAGGATVTPGNNTYGTAVQLLSAAQVTDDAFGILVCVNNLAVSGAARDGLANVIVTPPGGSATIIIPDLLVSCAGPEAGIGSGGVKYYFPLFIAAGSAVSVALSVNNATVGTGQSYVRLYGKPSGQTPRFGTFVRAFGTTPASSSGTAITPNGAGGKSAFVQLGAALTEPLWGWCLGVGCNNAVMNNNAVSWDLALGSSTTVNRRIIEDQNTYPTTSETLSFTSIAAPAYGNVGDLVFARAGGQGASPAGMSVAAYGIGG